MPEEKKEETVYDAEKPIDFEKQAEQLKKGNNDYLELKQGENEIKFLGNGKIYETEKSWDEEPQEYFKVKVEVDGEEYVWDMNKATTPNSKFGKLMRYARIKDGLKGETVVWYKQGSGTDTEHILMGLNKLEKENGFTDFLDED